MQDKVHQPYRKSLIPRLTKVLQSITLASYRGLLGIYLSGAGPTVLALATENYMGIAETIISTLSQFNTQERQTVECDWKLLAPAEDGATVTTS